MSSENSL